MQQNKIGMIRIVTWQSWFIFNKQKESKNRPSFAIEVDTTKFRSWNYEMIMQCAPLKTLQSY